MKFFRYENKIKIITWILNNEINFQSSMLKPSSLLSKRSQISGHLIQHNYHRYSCGYFKFEILNKTVRNYAKVSIDDLKMHTVLYFSKSSGPGGQNVNKVNTKAEGKFHIESAPFLPDDAKERLRLKHLNRINKNDELVVSSQVHREQLRNAEDVLLKIRDIIQDALIVPKERKIKEGRTDKGEFERRKMKDEQKIKKDTRSSKWQNSIF